MNRPLHPYAVRVEIFNTHGIAAQFDTPCYDLGVARAELAAELRGRRKSKRFYIVPNGKNSYYFGDLYAPPGVFTTVTIVPTWPAKTVYPPPFDVWFASLPEGGDFTHDHFSEDPT